MGTDRYSLRGAKVIGVDLTPRSIETSRKHLKLYGHAGEFAMADCERLPFADESFDVAYSNEFITRRIRRRGADHRVRSSRADTRDGLSCGSWAYWSQVVALRNPARRISARISANDIMGRYVDSTRRW
jgi:hypothetical protein